MLWNNRIYIAVPPASGSPCGILLLVMLDLQRSEGVLNATHIDDSAILNLGSTVVQAGVELLEFEGGLKL